METDASDNSVKISITGMEYTDGLMEKYITESTKKVIKKGKDIRGGQVERNTGESTRIT